MSASRCTACDGPYNPDPQRIHNQKIMQNTVRVPASLFSFTKKNLTIHQFQASLPAQNSQSTNWKAAGPMKNGSYARYLGKKTGNNLKTDTLPNGYKRYGIIEDCEC